MKLCRSDFNCLCPTCEKSAHCPECSETDRAKCPCPARERREFYLQVSSPFVLFHHKMAGKDMWVVMAAEVIVAFGLVFGCLHGLKTLVGL